MSTTEESYYSGSEAHPYETTTFYKFKKTHPKLGDAAAPSVQSPPARASSIAATSSFGQPPRKGMQVDLVTPEPDEKNVQRGNEGYYYVLPKINLNLKKRSPTKSERVELDHLPANMRKAVANSPSKRTPLPLHIQLQLNKSEPVSRYQREEYFPSKQSEARWQARVDKWKEHQRAKPADVLSRKSSHSDKIKAMLSQTEQRQERGEGSVFEARRRAANR